MFEKDLTKPIILEQHEALLRRLPENYIKKEEIQRKRDILNAGYKGEQKINYFLSLLPTKRYHIFHDIRLPIGKSFFQIDTILLSPTTNFLIEGKNLAGTLLFEKNQLIQGIKEETNTYSNPLAQVNRHKILLRYWFEKYGLPTVPFEHFVCISNSAATIKIPPGYTEAEKRVVKAENLLKKMDEYEKYYKKAVIDDKSINKMKKLFLNKHTPNRVELLAKYEIEQSNIITGVQCPKCLHIGMEYERGHWKCPICRETSKDAHISAIHDYFMIVKPTLNHAELRNFLHLPTARATTYQLSLLHISATGKTKDKIYHQPSDYDFSH